MSTATKRSPRAHFRFKGKYVKRLSFCIGGTVIAAWPSQVSPYFQEIKGTRTISDFRFTERVFSEGELPTTLADTRRLALRLRKALLRAERGTRYLSALRQRERLDLWLAGLPQKPRRKKRKLELSIATPADKPRRREQPSLIAAHLRRVAEDISKLPKTKFDEWGTEVPTRWMRVSDVGPDD
jgi:hypothetical protein